jgi:hypothetical protein
MQTISGIHEGWDDPVKDPGFVNTRSGRWHARSRTRRACRVEINPAAKIEMRSDHAAKVARGSRRVAQW